MSDEASVAASARDLRDVLDARLAARDRAGAISEALTAVRDDRIGIEQLYTHVLIPLLVDTGASWSQGRTQVWEEHFATATVRTIVESLYQDVQAQAARAQRNDRVIVLACPSGEVHDLGLRMLADRLTLHGWTAHFLGSDTPTEEIVAAAKGLGANVVALSVATHFSRALLREVMRELQAALPGVQVGVGGPAFAHDRDWPADQLIDDRTLGLSASPDDPAASSREDA